MEHLGKRLVDFCNESGLTAVQLKRLCLDSQIPLVRSGKYFYVPQNKTAELADYILVYKISGEMSRETFIKELDKVLGAEISLRIIRDSHFISGLDALLGAEINLGRIANSQLICRLDDFLAKEIGTKKADTLKAREKALEIIEIYTRIPHIKLQKMLACKGKSVPLAVSGALQTLHWNPRIYADSEDYSKQDLLYFGTSPLTLERNLGVVMCVLEPRKIKVRRKEDKEVIEVIMAQNN